MGTAIKYAFIAVLAALTFCVQTSPSSASSLLWQVKSNHPNILEIEFYSDTRRGHSWPGNNEIYLLDDYSTKTVNISCHHGELICYGAWVRNRTGIYWGIGFKYSQSCSDCCYTCNGGHTKLIILNP
ncbi:hypothetical protein [Roseibium sp.]|uniref:hypothetical protein n=1 Tax=Roseibium sp. TaxID=1936156 RepID=UPI003B515718